MGYSGDGCSALLYFDHAKSIELFHSADKSFWLEIPKLRTSALRRSSHAALRVAHSYVTSK